MKLSIIIPTHRQQGIDSVANVLMPQRNDIEYIVSWQKYEGLTIPEALKRSDVRILRFDGIGSSANRNNAMEHATGDIFLFADDDVTLIPDGIDRLIDFYESCPQADFVTFRSKTLENRIYPDKVTRLGIPFPQYYYPNGIEISLRKKTAGNLRFCPELGISVYYAGGEDSAFVITAIKRNLNCFFLPETLCSHLHDSTGTRKNPSSGVLMSSGMIIRFMYPVSFLLRVPVKAYRCWKHQSSPLFGALISLFKGAFAAPAFRRKNKRYLW